ncbi:hypothetical protein QZH41_004625 [Actinostola sp. cb2023]|nr:hypothetical protein QZH41_004625 [Actinostola sp. cb2023]
MNQFLNTIFRVPVKWIKFNTSPVSFGAKDNQYGPFNITQDGHIFTMKLVYLEGYVTNTKDKPITRSHWHSNNEFTGVPYAKLGILITDPARTRVLPLYKDLSNAAMNEYEIPGYDSMSPELVYKNFTAPYKVTAGQEFQVWYYQDFLDYNEQTNDGLEKIDVYGLYV